MAAHTHCSHDTNPKARAACRAEAKVSGGMHTDDCRMMCELRAHDNGLLDGLDRAAIRSLLNSLRACDPETWCHCRGYCEHDFCTNVYGLEG